MKLNFKFSLLIFFMFLNCIFFSFNIFANDKISSFYINSNIEIFSDGSVNIFSITNVDYLKNITHSQNFTTKNKDYWIFNLSTNKIFQDYIFELILPENVQINYIKTTPNIRFENEGNHIKLIGTGTEIPLNILIQYKFINSNTQINLNNNNNNNFGIFRYFFYFLMIFIFISILFYLFKIKSFDFLNFKIFFQKCKNNGNNVKDKFEFEKIDISIYSKRQQEILSILFKHNRKMTQKELEIIMGIPKSSISRNIKTLQLKGLIKKDQIGVTNYIYLK